MDFKKYIIFVIVLSFNCTIDFAQTPSWVWAKTSYVLGGFSESESVAIDNNGNIIVAGRFSSSSITFGNIVLSNNSISGKCDFFLVKYSPIGNVVWAKSYGGLDDESFPEVSTDANGNIILSGGFESNLINFGSFVLSKSIANSYSDFFIVKLGTNGNVLWAKSSGGAGTDWGIPSVDALGNIYIAGTYGSSSIMFDNINLVNSSGFSSQDFFLVKYSPSGNVIWAKSVGGNGGPIGGQESAKGISIDGNGNVIIICETTSTNISFDNVSITTNGLYDFCVVKYDPNGNVIWAKSAGGSSYDFGRGVSIDANANIYIVGTFSSSSIAFGSNTLLLSNASSSQQNSDIFIVKYDSNGNVIWAKSAESGYPEAVEGISTDLSGNVFLSGTFYSSCNFGNTQLLNNGPSGTRAMFIVKLDNNGNVIWAKSECISQSSYGAYPIKNMLDANDNLIIAGSFDLPNLILNGTTLTNYSYESHFVAKLNSATGLFGEIKRNGINIYPNPFYTKTQINFEKNVQNLQIEIYDIWGKSVYTQNFTGRVCSIEKGNLSPGVYFVQLNEKDLKYPIFKIIIE